MNVLVISRGFPSARNPMSGNFELDQAKSLVNLGHKVVILYVDRMSNLSDRGKFGISKKQEGDIIVYRISVVPLPLKKCFLGISSRIMASLGFILFKRILKDGFLPDVIHAHYLFNMPIALKIKEKYNIPVVATEHWSLIIKKHPRRDVISLAKICYSKVDRLISVSKSLYASIRSISGCDSAVIPNIVDTLSFAYKAKDSIKTGFVFVSVGNLIKRKGFDLLIKAFSKADFDKNVCLYIVGDGPEYKYLLKFVAMLNLQDQIFLLGRKTRAEIKDIFVNADAFVLSSKFETFGVVYIEALASGLPVIATRCGGPESFLSKEDGLIVPINDVDSLTSALKYMKQYRDLYDSKKIAERCLSSFSPTVVGREIESVYESVIIK